MSNIKLSMHEVLSGNYRLQLDGYYYKTWESYEMQDYHKHGRIEMMYVDEGECTVWVMKEGEKQESYTKITLVQGEGILCDSEVWHKLVVEGKCTIFNTEFLIVPCVFSLGSLKSMAVLSSELEAFLAKFKSYAVFYDKSNVKKLTKLLLAEAENKEEFADHENIQLLYCNLLLSEIARSYGKVIKSRSYDIHVKKAVKYIEMHVRDKVRSEEIAAYVGINYTYLERLFKSKTGMSIGEYVSKRKIELSESLLINTSLPISAISEQIGFGSRQQFNNIFKKINGVSPQKYRLNRNSGEGEIWYGFSGNYKFEIMKPKQEE